ncbi:hypothetical protein GQ600_4972 [Phytophthora cactorum]|nr:hypothetical protein GQ600_4972 [Phytophthora cactorum]
MATPVASTEREQVSLVKGWYRLWNQVLFYWMRLMPYLAPLQISNSDADSASVHSVSARMSAATNSQQVVETNWTVKNPGSVVPRSCNDYESWIVVQLRKECTEMKFRLHRKTSEAEQIRHLNAFDATRNSVQSAVDDENQLQSCCSQAKDCCIHC